MRNPLTIGAATLAVALTLGLAACGSSDSSDDEALTKSDLIAQADEICTEHNEELERMSDDSDLTNQSGQDEVVAFISDQIVPHYEEQIEDLRSLNPDDENAAAFNDIIDTLEADIQAVAEDPEAAMNQGDPFANATDKANEFGLKVCGAS